jgi:DNA-binding NarL/FixJ family response regulator
MRVLVFSPVRVFGECVAAALQPCAEIERAVAARAVADLPARCVELPADIVLFDVTGERALGEARMLVSARPDTPVLALAVPELAEHVLACADVGLVGYVPREASVTELVALMQMALRGECACSPRITGELFRELCRRQGNCEGALPDPPLTARETEVLRLVGRGHCNKEIARELNLSVATVKNHLHSVFAKLGVQRRAQAVDRILGHGPARTPWLERLVS